MAICDKFEKIEYYDSEKLIKEVEKRECLWNKNLSEYNDKNIRDHNWRKVCSAVLANWEELSDQMQEKTVLDVQRRWRNIKDSFRKDVNYQRSFSGDLRIKRRRYIFHEHLLFMLPIVTSNERPQTRRYKKEKNQSSEEEVDGDDTNNDSASYKRNEPILYRNEDLFEPLLQHNMQTEEIDEDKYFLLSLLPSLRSLPEDDKFAVKIEFLKILRKMRTSVCNDRVFDIKEEV